MIDTSKYKSTGYRFSSAASATDVGTLLHSMFLTSASFSRMSTETKILMLGATGKLYLLSRVRHGFFNTQQNNTGYIGGSVFLRLLDHPNFANFKITALVRSREKWNKLRKMGINAVRGSLSDLSLLESLASHADVVVSAVCASSGNIVNIG